MLAYCTMLITRTIIFIKKNLLWSHKEYHQCDEDLRKSIISLVFFRMNISLMMNGKDIMKNISYNMLKNRIQKRYSFFNLIFTIFICALIEETNLSKKKKII